MEEEKFDTLPLSVQVCSDKIDLPVFHFTLSVHEHHIEFEWSHILSNMKHMLDTGASTRCIQDIVEMKELIDKEVKDNERHLKQSFSCL